MNWERSALYPVMIFVFVVQPLITARSGPVEEAQARDAAAREDEAWRKRVYGDPSQPSATPITDKFAAIAFSAGTHQFGFAYGQDSLQLAQQKAVGFCKASDAKAIVWSQNGWYCALALAKDGSWGAKNAATGEKAKALALEECGKRAGDCKIVACVCSTD